MAHDISYKALGGHFGPLQDATELEILFNELGDLCNVTTSRSASFSTLNCCSVTRNANCAVWEANIDH
jgi:hypothetical protein